MFTQFNHVGINVRDIRTSMDFYTKYLGAKFVRGLYIPSGHTVGAYLQIGSFMLELLCPLAPNGNTRYGIDHIAFLVDDIAEESAALTEKGYRFIVRPKVAGSGGGLLAFISDPSEIKVELIERADSFLEEEWNPSCGVLGMDHASAYANELDASKLFFTKHVGMTVLHDYNFPERNFGMLYMNLGRNIMELLYSTKPHEGDVLGHIALRVDDCHIMAENLSAAGVTVMTQPKELATKNGSFCNILDPDGVQIELIDRASLFDVDG